MTYLFVGQDVISKDIYFKKLKSEFLPKEVEQFNLDILYARELDLKKLQERLLFLPIKAKQRIILIKETQNLKEELKKFILGYIRKPPATVILVLDIDRYNPKDDFVRALARHSKVLRFKESVPLDTFTLSRAIDSQKPAYALWLLNQLLKNGEKPERILGGLRYSWEANTQEPQWARRKLKLLLNCDIDIKTGRLKTNFALERLVVRLCYLGKSSG